MNNYRNKNLSLTNDSDGSNDETSFLNTEINSLCLNSDLDFTSNEEEYVSKGKHQSIKAKKSSFKLVVSGSHESGKSSGYSSSISPTAENPNYSVEGTTLGLVGVTTLFNATSQTPVDEKSRKLQIKNLLLEKIKKNKLQKNFNGSYLDFGDTILIKYCRQGQIDLVDKVLQNLRKNHNEGIINHQNCARETALSVATYQMKEVLIDLLLKNGASPTLKLPMDNNVLHIAASITMDTERKIFGNLIRGIQTYQSENIFETLTAKNIFGYDPISILQLYRDANRNNPLTYDRIQQRILDTEFLLYSSNGSSFAVPFPHSSFPVSLFK